MSMQFNLVVMPTHFLFIFYHKAQNLEEILAALMLHIPFGCIALCTPMQISTLSMSLSVLESSREVAQGSWCEYGGKSDFG